MSDRLTERLKQQLSNLGVAATDESVSRMLSDPKYRGRLTQLDPSYRRQATMADAVGTFLWHAAESSTAGVLGLTTESEIEQKYGRPWDEKDTPERIGAALGEVAGLINPYGAFGMMSKGLRGLTSLAAKESTRNITKRLAQEAGDTVFKAAGKQGAKNKVQDIIGRKTYQEVIKREAGNLSLGGTKQAESVLRIQENILPPIRKALLESGVEASDDLAFKVAQEFADGMRQGKHINNISRSVSSMFPAFDRPGIAGALNKYMGMVGQDMVMLGMYNSIAGGIESKKTGHEFDMANSLKHSAFLSLAFPAARAVPGGGKRSLKELRNLMGRYRGFNYKKLDDETLDATVRIMAGGKKYGTGALQNETFKVGKKNIKLSEYTNGQELVNSLSRTEKQELLGQIRNFTFSQKAGFLKFWTGDMIASIPRMSLGAMANNVDMFKDGTWARLPSEELLTHLLIGAFFTRSRGEWAHGNNRKMSDSDVKLNDVYKLADFLRLPVKDASGRDLDTYLRYADIDHAKNLYGASMEQNGNLRALFSEVDSYYKIAQERVENNRIKEADASKEPEGSQVRRVIEMYNLNLMSKDPNAMEMKLSYLTAKELSNLKAALNKTQVTVRGGDGKGQVFGEVGMGRLEVDNAIETGFMYQKRLGEFFNTLKKDLAEKGIDLPIIVDVNSEGKHSFRISQIQQGALDTREIQEFRAFVDFLRAKGFANVVETVGDQYTVKDKTDAQKISESIKKVQNEVQERLRQEMYGENMLGDTPDLFGLGFRETLDSSSRFENANNWVSVRNNLDVPENLQKYRQSIDKLFSFGVNETILDWSSIQKSLVSRKGDKKISGDELREDPKYQDALETLEFLHSVAKLRLTEVKSGINQREIDLSEVMTIKANLKKDGLDFTRDSMVGLKQSIREVDALLHYNKNVPAEKLYIFDQLKQVGLIADTNRGTARHLMPTEVAIRDYFEKNFESDITDPVKRKEAIENIVEKYKDVTRFMGSMDGTIEYIDAYGEFKNTGHVRFTEKDILSLSAVVPEVWYKNTARDLQALSESVATKMGQHSLEFVKTRAQEILNEFSQGGDSKIAKGKIDEMFKEIEFSLTDAKDSKSLEVIKDFKKHLKTRIDNNKAHNAVAEYTGDALRQTLMGLREADANMALFLTELNRMGSMHSTRPEAFQWTQYFKQRLIQEVNNKEFNDSSTIRELVDKYNETHTFADWNKLTNELVGYMTKKMGYREGYLENSIQKQLSYEEFLSRVKEPSHHLSLESFATEYGIEPSAVNMGQSRTGRKDPLHEDVTRQIAKIEAETDPKKRVEEFNKLIEDVSLKIENNISFSEGQKSRKIKRFKEIGAFWLLNSRIGTKFAKELQFENTNFIEKDSIVKVSERTRFKDALKKEFEIELLDVNQDKISIIDTKTGRRIDTTLSDAIANRETRKIIENSFIIPESIIKGETVRLGEDFDGMSEGFSSNLKTPKYYILDSPSGKFFGIRQADAPKIDTAFEAWYNRSLEMMKNEDPITRKNFENAFKDLVEIPADNPDALNMKFRALHVSASDPIHMYSLFKGINGEVLVDAHRNPERLAAWEAQATKYSKQFEGGNGLPISKAVVDIIARTHPDSKTKTAFAQFNKGQKVLAMADETGTDIFSAQKVVLNQIDSQIKRYKKGSFKYEALQGMKADIENGLIPSIGENVSSKNALTLISEAEARVYSLLNNVKFDPTEVNGWKNNLNYVGEDGTTVKQKTWQVYIPRQDALFDKLGVSQISFKSALKSFGSMDGKKQPFLIEDLGTSKDWADVLMNTSKKSLKNSIIEIPTPEATNMGFHNHTSNQVTLGNTINNLLGEASQRLIRAQQGHKRNIELQQKMYDEMLVDAERDVAKIFTDWAKSDSQGFQSDAQSLASKLVELGVKSDNPIVRDSIDRLFMSKLMTSIRKPQVNGSSSYLINDEIFVGHGGNRKRLELSNPLLTKFAGDGSTSARMQVGIGGAAAPYAWGQQLVPNKESLRLVTEIGGRDVIVGYENGKFKVIDPLNKIEKTITEGKELKAFKEFMKSERIDPSEIQRFIDNLDFNKGLTHQNIYDRLQEKGIDAYLSASLMAIPRKSADVVYNKIEAILKAEKGNNWVLNDYELAVTHQRDFDGDHIYAYNNLPMRVIENNLFQTAQIRDYKSVERQTPNLNSFGFMTDFTPNSNSRAGNMDYYVSVAQSRAESEAKRRLIGQVIGMNTPLTWMDNLGLTIGGKQFKFNLRPENINETLEIVGRMATVGQVAVDYTKADMELMRDKPKLLDVILFGENADAVPKQSRFGGEQSSFQALKLSGDIGKRTVEKAIVEALMFRLREASNVFNDPFDGGRQRNVTVDDLSFSYERVHNLFRNPNKIIFNDLITRNKNNEAFKQEIVKYFFGEGNTGVTDAVKSRDALQKVLAQNIQPTNNVISFGEMKADNRAIERLFDKSTSGYLLRKLGGQDSFIRSKQNDEYSNISLQVSEARNNRGTPESYSNRAYENVLVTRMLGGDLQDTAFTEQLKKALDLTGSMDLQQIHRLSTSIELLDQKANRLVGKINYESTRRQPQNIEPLKDQLESIRLAKNKIQEHLLRNTFRRDDSSNYSIGGKKGNNYRTHKGGDLITANKQGRYVYEIKSDKKIKDITISELSQDGVLKYVGYVQKGKTMDTFGGSRQYISFESPVKTHNIAKKSVLLGQSWMLATAKYDSASLARRLGVDELGFISDVQRLKEDLRNSFKFAKENAFDRNSTANSMRVWEMQSDYEQAKIRTFMEKAGEDAQLMQDIAHFMLIPDPITNHVTKVGGVQMPVFATNKRFMSALMKFMNDNGHLEKGMDLARTLKNVEQYTEFLTGERTNPPQDFQDSNAFIQRWQSNNEVGNFQNTIQSLLRRKSPTAKFFMNQIMDSPSMGTGKKIVGYKNVKMYDESGTSAREDAIMYYLENRTNVPKVIEPMNDSRPIGSESMKISGKDAC